MMMMAPLLLKKYTICQIQRNTTLVLRTMTRVLTLTVHFASLVRPESLSVSLTTGTKPLCVALYALQKEMIRGRISTSIQPQALWTSIHMQRRLTNVSSAPTTKATSVQNTIMRQSQKRTILARIRMSPILSLRFSVWQTMIIWP